MNESDTERTCREMAINVLIEHLTERIAELEETIRTQGYRIDRLAGEIENLRIDLNE